MCYNENVIDFARCDMKRENSRKIKLLRLWEILRQETDENHPITTNELIARLKKEGIDVDRKILYTDIDLLNENGYEVLCERGKSNRYYVVDRSFDIPEVRILMDAVQAAGFITEKKTKILIDKIAELAGSRRAEVLKENITEFSTVKSENESIYYSIDTIVSAKEAGKQIGFYYFDYNIKREKSFRPDKKDPNVNKWYVVNPVETVYDNDQYYLICYDDKHKSLANYRIDRMDRVTELDSPITKIEEIDKIDISKHKRQLFEMYGGEVKKVTFVASTSMIDVIFDKFGNLAKMAQNDDGTITCTVEVQTGPMFIAWLCSFDKRIRVVSPQAIVKRVKEHLEQTLEQYSKE